MNSPQKQINSGRQTLYYVGMAVTVVGALLFFSVFVISAMNFGNFHNFDGHLRSFAVRSVQGMGMMILGRILMTAGAKGLAGSGIVLDPKKARADLEPWNRMAGGMANDALSEVDVVNKLEEHLAQPAPQIKIRCRQCQALNDEIAKFCNQCGAAL